ncbi:hypothetical protein EGY31_05500 [Burkholderia multivorans]|uniref:hypothetical protein n=1 Tax=Burkholderia ubonensis TaxID=101571 RepID=UPI000F6E1382|nr:hypothetical protein [Burkholderia ubonensis]AYZ62750.1 hypothetical protein EGY31_05500 [Burkholderia multivorans]VWB37036.1 hypothetical protein BUB20358_01610 [Burkholderia ubonensis]
MSAALHGAPPFHDGISILDMYRILSTLSDPCACIASEDVLGHVQRGDRFNAWAIDGASFLTDHPFTTFDDRSDAHWFAAELSAFLARELSEREFDAARLRPVLEDLRQRYLALSPDTPLWAYPAAACTIVELQRSGDQVVADIHQYADCFALFGAGRTDEPAPAVDDFRSTASRIQWRPRSGFSGEQLARQHERRIEQQHNRNTTALTLNPDSAANGIHVRQTFAAPCQLLLGTDGVSRAWEYYGLVDQGDVIDFVSRNGLPALFARLRHHEENYVNPEMKSRDDAAALHVLCV